MKSRFERVIPNLEGTCYIIHMGKKREPIKTYILTASFFGQQWQGYVRIPIFQAVKKTISPFLSGFLMSRIEVKQNGGVQSMGGTRSSHIFGFSMK